ncbi:hypothetical protein NE237_006689 [Protea cynaroides]|uniref:Helicase C-terminal domain-containing protein n=1 Tax=Protea cynaroides TaxID=273540 RepID=A0A9Q0QVP8_9MAGN|nr:hypothetical protein NE237_006689 [Protea cynaroides]
MLNIDVKDIKCVINYNFPMSLEDYVHRIGRTGRAGAKGTAFTFFTDANAKFAKHLIKILQEAGLLVSLALASLGHSGGYGEGGSGGSFSHSGGEEEPLILLVPWTEVGELNSVTILEIIRT